MNCEALIRNLGFRCREVRSASRRGPVYALDTPFHFPDGEAFTLYAVPHAPQVVELSDNGDTLMHLMGLGFPLDDRRRWRGLRDLCEKLHLSLEERGDVRTQLYSDDLASGIEQFGYFMHAVCEWEVEHRGLTDHDHVFIDEVEVHLRAWKPDLTITRDISAYGASGSPRKFDFLHGDTLVDAVRPSSQKTGAELRKVLDVANGDDERPILVIMDDRSDAQRAREETAILATVARVMQMSALIRHAPVVSAIRSH
ncbi:DUF1828 domain-containing protein [Arhodomonas sp. AD133]|uniref:DUF1828 domain-containing protein n=1 Tax=Arhodomonas sp. AD133 TaxID=3415009 RepID=UPI003EB855F3